MSTAAVGAAGTSVNVGLCNGALKLNDVATEVPNDESSFNASANSPRVFNAVPASPISAVIAASVYAVVATCVLFVPGAAVGAVGVPVNAGEASGAKPEIEAPEGIVTVPVNVGLARFAFNASAAST